MEDPAALPPVGGAIEGWIDSAIALSAEGVKTVTQQTYHLGGQLVSGAVGFLLSHTFEPGYAAARRARIAVARAANDLAKRSEGKFDSIAKLLHDFEATLEVAGEGELTPSQAAHGSADHPLSSQPAHGLMSGGVAASGGNLLESSGEQIAHQGQPTGANRWSPGVVEEARLWTLVAIDATALSCRRGLRRMCGSTVPAAPSTDTRRSILGCCRRNRNPLTSPISPQLSTHARSSRNKIKSPTVPVPRGRWLPALRVALPRDLLSPPPTLVSDTRRGSNAGKLTSRKPRTWTPQPMKRSHSSPASPDPSTHARDPAATASGAPASSSGGATTARRHAGGVSTAYWPMPKLTHLSVACHLIDAICGYPVQTYAVRTVDGYILTLVRIPRVESRKVAFFQHGLLDSASAWVSTGNVHSLAARAYQAGYDVFLGNLRGSNDALGVNGFGSNPADYGEQVSQEDRAKNGLAGVAANLRHLASKTVNKTLSPLTTAASVRPRRAASGGMEGDGVADTAAATAGASEGAGVGGVVSDTLPLRAGSDHIPAGAAHLSPLRGGGARARSVSVDSTASLASRVAEVQFIGTSADGIPVHETLHPRQPEYWNYQVDDHVLDVMAFVRQIRIIKALERAERQAMQPAAPSTASSASAHPPAAATTKGLAGKRAKKAAGKPTQATRQPRAASPTHLAAMASELLTEAEREHRNECSSVRPAMGDDDDDDDGGGGKDVSNPFDRSVRVRKVGSSTGPLLTLLPGGRSRSLDRVCGDASSVTSVVGTPHTPPVLEGPLLGGFDTPYPSTPQRDVHAQPPEAHHARSGGSAAEAPGLPPLPHQQQRSRHPHQRTDATSTDADDCQIFGIGHSMGGCVLMLYIMFANALRRPHWLTKLVLLSPAGFHKHLGWGPRVVLFSLYYMGLLNQNRPFPMRSSTMQRFAARLLQDAKRMQATGDLMAVLGSLFFGGERHRFVFRFVSFTEYPVGGTCFKVMRQGIQNMITRDFQPYNHGEAENSARYGSPAPPSYRSDYGLLDIPVHIVAGGRDLLVPVENLEEQFALINMISPGLVSMRTFDKAGHLDFTLTLADEIISHVMDAIEGVGTPTLPPPSILHNLAARHSAARRTPSLAVIPPIEHVTTNPSSEEEPVGGDGSSTRVQGLAGPSAKSNKYYSLPTSISSNPSLVASLEELAGVAQRRAALILDPATGARKLWVPVRQLIGDFPWLACFTKLDLVLDGFDQEAHEFGLSRDV